MSKIVEIKSPSFPNVRCCEHLSFDHEQCWQVLCGDRSHWRAGIYSPAFSSEDEITELERHSCPELFMLIDGKVTLVVEENGQRRKLQLEHGKPVMVSTWHNAYCPNGAYTGKAFVVERDEFITEYKSVKDLTM